MDRQMPRTTDDFILQTPSARVRLFPNAEPYYRTIAQGLAIGYRRAERGGSWLARIRLPETARYAEIKLGRADDLGLIPDEKATMTFDQAVRAARTAFAQAEARRTSGTLPGAERKTVGELLDLYIEGYVSGDARAKEKPGRDLTNVKSIIERHLRPALGAVRIEHLNADQLKAFKAKLTKAPRLTRSGRPLRSDTPPSQRGLEPDRSEIERKRRARTNRIITTLRAALNYAVRENFIATDAAWRTSLKPYGDVDAATIRYLTLDECKRLQSSVDEDFRQLVKGALVTGCRYGSLRYLRAGDVDLAARSAIVTVTKNGKPQTIRFTTKGCAFVKSMIKGKARGDFVFTKASGAPWKPSDQQRRMQEGCAAAAIDPPIGFHGLRDTFASHLVMDGVPLLTVSKLLGHADTRTTEKYYAHLAPDYLHQAIDDHLPDF
jgi:integrase